MDETISHYKVLDERHLMGRKRCRKSKFCRPALFALLLCPQMIGAQDTEGEYNLVETVESDGGGYFAGATSADFKLIAIGGYVNDDPQVTADERFLTFFDQDGNVINTVNIGDGSWAVAMTPDGEKTVAGSDDENLYISSRLLWWPQGARFLQTKRSEVLL